MGFDKKLCVWDVPRALMVYSIDTPELLKDLHAPATLILRADRDKLSIVTRRLHIVDLIPQKEQAAISTSLIDHSSPIVCALPNDEFDRIATVDTAGHVIVWSSGDGEHIVNFMVCPTNCGKLMEAV